MEKTLVLIKPDAVKKNVIGKIIDIYEQNNLYVENLKMVLPVRKTLEEHYEEHKEKPFFEKLIGSIEGKKVVAIVISGENSITKVRKINGNTDPMKADKGTIRNLYGSSISENAVHGSSDVQAAEREITIWFKS